MSIKQNASTCPCRAEPSKHMIGHNPSCASGERKRVSFFLTIKVFIIFNPPVDSELAYVSPPPPSPSPAPPPPTSQSSVETSALVFSSLKWKLEIRLLHYRFDIYLQSKNYPFLRLNLLFFLQIFCLLVTVANMIQRQILQGFHILQQ